MSANQRRSSKFTVAALCVLLVGIAGSGSASAKQQAAMVSFSVTTATEVPNTRLRLLLQAIVQENGNEHVLSALAANLNQRMNAALHLIESTPGVSAQTRGMRSSAVYDKGKQVGWRLVGQIEAVGAAKMVPELAGKLQAAGLSVESVQAEPSAEALRVARERQSVAAIDELKKRALTVAKALGCSAWSFAEVSLHDQASRPPVGIARMAAVQPEPAALAAGASRVEVRAEAKMRCLP